MFAFVENIDLLLLLLFLDHSLNVIFVGVAKSCWVLFYFIPL